MELLRLLLGHPGVEIAAVTSRSAEGPVGAVHPHLAAFTDLAFTRETPGVLAGLSRDCDVLFQAKPHGVSARETPDLLASSPGLRVIDLSGDFRLRDGDAYPTWYGYEHPRPAALAEAAYGLPECGHRDAIRSARLVANPGCHATASILALWPLSRRLGLAPRLVQGRRVTDEATLDVAKRVFAGSINLDILAALRGQGIHAVGLSGVDGDILHARRRPPMEVRDDATGETTIVDFGHVGDVTEVHTTLLSLLVSNEYVPVVSSLGSDAEGNVLNINADTVAAVLARDLGAAKLISLTPVPGFLAGTEDPSSVISRLYASEARELLASGRISGGMAPKLQSLVDAVPGGVGRGHILSGVDENALLLELFTKRGVGTLVEPDPEAGPV